MMMPYTTDSIVERHEGVLNAVFLLALVSVDLNSSGSYVTGWFHSFGVTSYYISP